MENQNNICNLKWGKSFFFLDAKVSLFHASPSTQTALTKQALQRTRSTPSLQTFYMQRLFWIVRLISLGESAGIHATKTSSSASYQAPETAAASLPTLASRKSMVGSPSANASQNPSAKALTPSLLYRAGRAASTSSTAGSRSLCGSGW